MSNNRLVYLPYTYLIGWSPEQTGLDQEMFYYGCRYKKGCHPDLFWVNYFTSSPLVKEKRLLWGEPSRQEIKHVFHGLAPGNETGLIVRTHEHEQLVLVNAARNPYYLNKSNGGARWGTCTSGMVTAINNETRVSSHVPQKEFYENPKLYTCVSKGTVLVVEHSTGNKLRVPVDDPRLANGEFVPITTGQVTVRDLNGDTFNVSVDDPRLQTKEVVHITTGFVTVKDPVTSKTKRVSKTDPDYLSGNLIFYSSGTVPVIDPSNGKTIIISNTDERFLSGKLKHAGKGVKKQSSNCQHCKLTCSKGSNLNSHEKHCMLNPNRVPYACPTRERRVLLQIGVTIN